jgi:two-component system OmpR family response regulator
MSYILAIEDDRYLCEVLKMYLETKDLNIFCYHKYNEIKSCLEKNGAPEIVLLDYVLEGENVENIVKLLKLFKKTIVLMTASNHAEDIFKNLDLDILLKKPFNLEQLDSIINKVFKLEKV